MRQTLSQQKGAALILAIFIVALAATIATRISFRIAIEDKSFDNASRITQSRLLLYAAEQWAIRFLRADAKQNSIDHAGEVWAQRLPPVDAEGHTISGAIVDEQGKFNINWLIDNNSEISQPHVTILQKLLDNLFISSIDAYSIASYIKIELDERLVSNSSLPYSILTIDELNDMLRRKGIDLSSALPFITALPNNTSLNVNTASAELLSACMGGMFMNQAESLVESRSVAWFKSLSDFRSRIANNVNELIPVSVSSDYFSVSILLAKDGRAFLRRALIDRTKINNEVIWRTSS